MKLLITGDLVINKEYPESNLNEDLIRFFSSSDFNITNLECPITDATSEHKIIKTGPHLKGNKPSTNKILKDLNINAVTLANNHVLDYGEKGVRDTLSFCKDNNIKTIGAGMNLQRASEILYLDSTEGKIAIVNFAENEWASATRETAGSNPMNLIDNINQIKQARLLADFIFVIVHGGHEYYNLPSPRMQRQYRFYAENGADLVVGHHTHCISGYEVHKGIPIYYSLGNFLFTKISTHKDWYTGLVLEVEISKGKLNTTLHPTEQQKEDFQLNLIKGEAKDEVLARIDTYSEIIKNETELGDKWANFINFKYNGYLNYLSPLSFIKNRYLRIIFNKLGLRMINKDGIALSLNLIRCEAHADISKEVSRKYLSNK